jgi:hypothetical protein
MRQDLLSLTIDDLVTLSNRGIVKRSQQELQSGQLTCELNEDNQGNVSVRWSDQVECQLPGDRTLTESTCSCPATTLCRHLIRSVLVYQANHLNSPLGGRDINDSDSDTPVRAKHSGDESCDSGKSDLPNASPLPLPPSTHPPIHPSTHLPPFPHPPTSPPTPWNPADIPDTTLATFFKKPTLTKLKQQFDEGHVVTLTRGSKAIAHFHTLPFTIRFLVEGDLRYTHCDCTEKAPCNHVPLAIWAFRLLDNHQSSGIVSTRQTAYPVPTALLDDIEERLQELALAGVAGVSQGLRDQMHRLEMRCREHRLIWCAEILSELLLECDRHHHRDARFSPENVVRLMGELCIRSDAIRNDTGAVPQLFIRGSQSDQTQTVGSARLIGLGCAVQLRPNSAELTAYCQDIDSGKIVALRRSFPDPPDAPETAKDFSQLAQTPIVKGISFDKLGTGQLLVKVGKRTPSSEFLPGRAPISFNPQAFQWESLRAPTLVEDFAELGDRLRTLPPASLRPRHLGENLFVCKIAAVEAATFNPIDQTIEAVLRDRHNTPITLIHPYTHRGRSGAESLLSTLTHHPTTIQFAAGQIHPHPHGLTLTPISLLLQQSNHRTILQPWIAPISSLPPSPEQTFHGTSLPIHPSTRSPHRSSIPSAFICVHLRSLSDLLTTGLHRANSQTLRHWQELERQGAASGFVQLLKPIQQITASLTQKTAVLQWDGRSAAEAVLAIALLVKLAEEQFGGD